MLAKHELNKDTSEQGKDQEVLPLHKITITKERFIFNTVFL